MKISSPGVAKDLAHRIQAFLIRFTSSSIVSPRVLITSCCISSSSTAFFQSIFGSNATSQGYPSTILSSPRSVTKNFMSLLVVPHRTWRSTKWVIAPALLCIPSIFQMVHGFFNWSVLIFICFRTLVLMKLSVAPESMRISFSAFLCEDYNRVGIFKLLYLHANTLLTPKVRAQAVRVAHLKNPYLHLRLPCLPQLPFGGV